MTEERSQVQASRPIRIIAITRKPESPSFEHRITRYRKGLTEYGIELTFQTLPRSVRGQWQVLKDMRRYDGVWWHRHLLSPWVSTRLHKGTPPIVFDFDDPLVYSARGGGQHSWSRQILFSRMLRRSSVALAASKSLADLALPFCPSVVEIPMAVDIPTRIESPVRATNKCLELLWLGTEKTQPYLDLIRRPLMDLGYRKDVKLRLVAHKPMTFGDLEVDFRPWSANEQTMALQACDIGLCPMPDTVWTRGKCPYKVLQYMAHAMPWIGSAVGENRIMAGSNLKEQRGLCASSNDQWMQMLVQLTQDANLRRTLGNQSYKYVVGNHCRSILINRLAKTWRNVLGQEK